MKTEFQKIIEDLTPEEKKALKDVTAPQWIRAIQECVNDPEFWKDIFTAFIFGIVQGLSDAIEDREQVQHHK